MSSTRPALVVLSSLFPSPAQPGAGLFIRERMFRVAKELPVVVVAPQPWFPGQSVARLFRRGFRPSAPRHEVQQGVEVLRPRFLSFPGALKRLDGWLMAAGSYVTLRSLCAKGRCDLVDAHFGYPEGYAASLLGRWLARPFTVTLRGTEPRHARDSALRKRLRTGLGRAARIFAVATALKDLAVELGIPAERVTVVGNGVDTAVFHPVDRAEARRRLGIEPDARVLVSVGALVERKGFHRVFACLESLRERHPGLVYLVVGGPSPEGDWGPKLRLMAREAGVESAVRFLGALAPDELRAPLSAADVFVLATSNEGWANVFLEAMACGLPIVTTDVGGNREVVSGHRVGIVVPFGDTLALASAIDLALTRDWDRAEIVSRAQANSWDGRVRALVGEFRRVHAANRGAGAFKQPVPGECS